MKEISITTQFKAFDAIPDLPTDIQELMLQAVEVRKMPMLRTLNLELELHPLDNGEIVLARTKKTQLILQDFAQNALQFFMQVPFIQQQNFENGNHSSFGYQPNYYPYSALWFLQTIYCRV
jgi:hypothetical protein